MGCGNFDEEQYRKESRRMLAEKISGHVFFACIVIIGICEVVIQVIKFI